MSEPRLVDVWTARVAPDHVVRELRSIDRRAELLYVQRGKWWLGLVKQNIPLIEVGHKEMKTIWKEGGATWPTLRMAQLKCQGFRYIELPRERWPLDPLWGFIVHWFREVNWRYLAIPDSDSGWDQAFKRHERAMTNEPEREELTARLLDHAMSDRRSLMRRIQRSPYITVQRAVNE